MGVRVISLLPSKDGLLIINDKIDRERGIFEPNMLKVVLINESSREYTIV